MSVRLAIAGAVLTGLLGAVLGGLWTARGPALPPAPDRRAELDELRAQLAAERDARRALEGEIAMLRIALGDPAEEIAPGEPDAPHGAPDPATVAASPDAHAPSPHGSAGAAGAAIWDDADALASAGIDPAEAQRLKERFEEHEMALLFLRDRARREGWLRRPRFRSEQEALRDALRDEVGNADYDRMLWLAGRNNRVTVADVIGKSEAQAAGLEPGDQIFAYAGQPIFEVSQLTRATSEGRAGESTELRYRRGGEERRVYLPRGPLGVRLRSERGTPDTFR